MKFTAPTDDQRATWADFRFRCMNSFKHDPGPCPEQWPADPAGAAKIAQILKAADCDAESFEQVRAAFRAA
jgi:hypothetical protein